MRSFRTIALGFILLFGLFVFVPQSAHAQSLSDQVNKQIDATASKTELQKEDPRLAVARAIRAFSSIIGIVFMMLIVYGGFLRMTATGEEEKVKKSTKVITGAIIGLAVVIFSYSISTFVIKILYSNVASDSPYGLEAQQTPKDTWTIPLFQK